MASTSAAGRTKTRPGGRSARVREAVAAATRSELREKGYEGLSRRVIAKRAGVDATTVYRRWPTRAHIVADLLLDLAEEQVQVPDTGRVSGDLAEYLTQIVAMFGDPELRRMIQALSSAASEGDEEIIAALRTFWRQRFNQAFTMLARAAERSELRPGRDYQQVIETLVAPAWFRALVSHEPLDEVFIARCVSNALIDPAT